MTMENEVKDSVLKRAWRTVRNYYAKALGVEFVYFLVGILVAFAIIFVLVLANEKILEDYGELSKFFQWFVQFLLQPLVYGASIFFLYAVRKNGPKFSMLFCGFDDFKRIAGTLYLRGIYIFLWSLLLFVPGLIRHYDYAMTPFLLHDHPELKFNEALKRSKKMMDGYKGSLFSWDMLMVFMVVCVFILLGILFALSMAVCGVVLSSVLFGIVFFLLCLTLTMIYHALYAEFYEDLKEETNTEGASVEPKVERSIRREEPQQPKADESQETYAKDYR